MNARTPDGRERRTCLCGCQQEFLAYPDFRKDYVSKRHRKHAEYIRWKVRKYAETPPPNPTLAETRV
jgi:hypothetical protein